MASFAFHIAPAAFDCWARVEAATAEEALARVREELILCSRFARWGENNPGHLALYAVPEELTMAALVPPEGESHA